MFFAIKRSKNKNIMKTLKIKKTRKKICNEVTPYILYYDYMEHRDYVVQMTEEEYFEYIRWKGETPNEK